MIIGIYYFAIVNLSFSLVTSFQFTIFARFTFKMSSGKIAILFMKRTIHKKGIVPTDKEEAENHRAHSARLRVIERIKQKGLGLYGKKKSEKKNQDE